LVEFYDDTLTIPYADLGDLPGIKNCLNGY
jgi:hypothetical protein